MSKSGRSSPRTVIEGKGECELRPIFEASDFPAEVISPEQAAREDAVREDMRRNAAKS